MTTFRQFEANRRNARKSTGPVTEEGKQVSRCNAVRHGLTAETVIGGLEDAEDYKAFEAAIIADYDAQSAVERELVLRLASVLWRLRRFLPSVNQGNEHRYGTRQGNEKDLTHRKPPVLAQSVENHPVCEIIGHGEFVGIPLLGAWQYFFAPPPRRA